MSRRADTPVPVFANRKNTASVRKGYEQGGYEKRAPRPDTKGTKAVPAPIPAAPEPKVVIPKGQFFATKEEIREAWEKSRKLGKCVVCGCKIRNGFEGHISKCLRLSKFKTASTPTS